MNRIGIALSAGVTCAVTTGLLLSPVLRPALPLVQASEAAPAAVSVDYPRSGSIFPPEITPPTFIWHDAAEGAKQWHIDITFADGSAALHVVANGERPRIGEIDPRCISSTNALPTLSPEQAAAHTWTPDAATWAMIKKHSAAKPATVTIAGFRRADPQHRLSSGSTELETSKDPVGAPIFYRDVPLMPSETVKGVISPLAADAVQLIQWRLRSIDRPQSRVVLTGMHILASESRFDEADSTIEKALQIDPRNRDAQSLHDQIKAMGNR